MLDQLDTNGAEPAPVTPAALFGRSPGKTFAEIAKRASWRATRTMLQALAAAFASSTLGPAILGAAYWRTFGFACLGVLFAGAASFLHNIAFFMPEDPTQSGSAKPTTS